MSRSLISVVHIFEGCNDNFLDSLSILLHEVRPDRYKGISLLKLRLPLCGSARDKQRTRVHRQAEHTILHLCHHKAGQSC